MDEIVVHHQLSDGHEFEQILGDSEGQGSLACCSPWSEQLTIWWSLMENLMEFPKKIRKYDFLYDTENYTPGYLSEDDENTN